MYIQKLALFILCVLLSCHSFAGTVTDTNNNYYFGQTVTVYKIIMSNSTLAGLMDADGNIITNVNILYVTNVLYATNAIIGSQMGVGITNPTAGIQFRVSKDGNTMVPALITTDGIICSGDNTYPGITTVASTLSSTSYRGVFKGVKCRGTLAEPLAVENADLVVDLLGGAYDGYAVRNNGAFVLTVDGTVASNVVPMRAEIWTSTGGARTVSMTVYGNKSMSLNNMVGPPITPASGCLLYATNDEFWVLNDSGDKTQLTGNDTVRVYFNPTMTSGEIQNSIDAVPLFGGGRDLYFYFSNGVYNLTNQLYFGPHSTYGLVGIFGENLTTTLHTNQGVWLVSTDSNISPVVFITDISNLIMYDLLIKNAYKNGNYVCQIQNIGSSSYISGLRFCSTTNLATQYGLFYFRANNLDLRNTSFDNVQTAIFSRQSRVADTGCGTGAVKPLRGVVVSDGGMVQKATASSLGSVFEYVVSGGGLVVTNTGTIIP